MLTNSQHIVVLCINLPMLSFIQMMADIPMPTAETLERDQARYEELFRARYTNEDPEYK